MAAALLAAAAAKAVAATRHASDTCLFIQSREVCVQQNETSQGAAVMSRLGSPANATMEL